MITEIILILFGIIIGLIFVKFFTGVIVWLIKAIINLVTDIADTITGLWS